MRGLKISALLTLALLALWIAHLCSALSLPFFTWGMRAAAAAVRAEVKP